MLINSDAAATNLMLAMLTTILYGNWLQPLWRHQGRGPAVLTYETVPTACHDGGIAIPT